MNIGSLIGLAVPLAIACAIPGPTTMVLVARVTTQGTRGIWPFCLGLILGDLVWLLVATAGAAVLATSFKPVLDGIRWIGAAYLLYVAWKLWSEPVHVDYKPSAVEPKERRLIFAGLALALGNAKTAMFYVALVPTFVPLERITLADIVALSATVIAVYGGVLVAYVYAALRAQRLFRNGAARRMVNRVGGVVIAISAVLVIAI